MLQKRFFFNLREEFNNDVFANYWRGGVLFWGPCVIYFNKLEFTNSKMWL